MLPPNSVDVNACDENGERPLLRACRAGAYEIAQQLLKQGASAATPDGEEDSPLHWLCAFDSRHIPSIAAALVKAGGRLDCQTTAKVWEWESDEMATFASGTPLLRAISRNNQTAVRQLYQLGASLRQASKHAPYHTPLTLACSLHLGPTEVLRFLLERTPAYTPNQTYGPSLQRLPAFMVFNSPLQLAQLHGDGNILPAMAQTLQLLNKAGERFCDPERGFSLIHLAAKAGRRDLLDLLLSQEDERHEPRANLSF